MRWENKLSNIQVQIGAIEPIIEETRDSKEEKDKDRFDNAVGKLSDLNKKLLDHQLDKPIDFGTLENYENIQRGFKLNNPNSKPISTVQDINDEAIETIKRDNPEEFKSAPTIPTIKEVVRVFPDVDMTPERWITFVNRWYLSPNREAAWMQFGKN